ncbi:MAG: hypothetical protein KAW84_05035 [Thermoplasmata archaeon]|nr:hypothetical protein [Thermoplasmata archaeon]
MMPEKSMKADGKKYMWDGYTYNEEDTGKSEDEYREMGFETIRIARGDGHLIYMRKLVTDFVLELEGET